MAVIVQNRLTVASRLYRDIQSVVARVIQYHKDGIKFSEDFIEEVLQVAGQLSLEPHKLLGVLAISRRARLRDEHDLANIARSSADLFKTEWPDSEYAKGLTGSQPS